MPRKARLFVPGAIYHVYSRTARGELAFSAEAEAEAFVNTARAVRDLDGFTILAWCLMGSHYHFALRTRDVPLWRSMARLQGRTARDFNRRHGYLGRLWQSRYKARVVDSERYYNQVVAYVHLNPVAAGLVDDPAAYRWTGHRALIGRGRPLLVDVAESLRGFGRTTFAARRNYLSSLRAVAEARWLAEGLPELPWWVEAKDAEVVADGHNNPDGVRFDGCVVSPELPRIALEELALHFCHWQGIELDALSSTGRLRATVEGRIALTAIAAQSFEHSLKDLSRLLEKNPGTVSGWLSIARRRQLRDDAFRAKLREGVETIVQLHNATD